MVTIPVSFRKRQQKALTPLMIYYSEKKHKPNMIITVWDIMETWEEIYIGVTGFGSRYLRRVEMPNLMIGIIRDILSCSMADQDGKHSTNILTR